MRPPTDNERDPSAPHADVVVIGGTNIDVKCRTKGRATLHTSNPGDVVTTPGGVARNIAENLGRLGARVALVSAVGDDSHGNALLDAARDAGVDVHDVLVTAGATGSYTAVLDTDGELVIGVAAMAAMDALTEREILARRNVIERARILVLECNLGIAALTTALEVAHSAGVPVIVDPVSVVKSAALRSVLRESRPVFTITPNRAELIALSGLETDDVSAQVADLHARGVEHVWVRMGGEGSVLGSRDASGLAQHIAALPAHVQDVTGAGDAMTAGYVFALLLGKPPALAARYGHAAAALTIASHRTVSPAMAADALDRLLGAVSHPPVEAS